MPAGSLLSRWLVPSRVLQPAKPWHSDPRTPPACVTVRRTPGTKLAETFLAASMVTVHGPEPLHAPDQPVNASVAEVAVRVTTVPWTKSCEQVVPQTMPPTSLVTTPVPMPVLAT